MMITASASFLVSLLLVSIRIGAVLVFTPLFAMGGVPARIRLFLSLALAFFLLLAVPVDASALPVTTGALVEACAFELVLGATLAFGVSAAFAALQLGGRALDFQLGFGVANLIDPATRGQAPLLGTVLGMMAVTLFFALNGHHFLIRGLAASLTAIPPGSGGGHATPGQITQQFGLVFAFGLAAVAAPVVALLLLDTGLAIAARTMPQFNMFILGIPMKIMLGLTVLAVSIPSMRPLLVRLYERIFLYWQAALG